MKVTLWGTRGSLAAAGPETVRYGGNTSSVEVRGEDGTVLVLDAGTGIRRLGATLATVHSVDLLLTHLHMDHLQGLGFFDPIYRPDVELRIWGPPSTTLHLQARLLRYLSPPLFPVHLRDLPCRLFLDDVPFGRFRVGELEVEADLVCHPGPTVGYRITEGRHVLTYIPDHEPALGARTFPPEPEWTSGFALAEGADLLIHDAQFSDEEYPRFVGYGHSAISHVVAFARLAGVRRLVTFHHNPGHSDDDLDRLVDEARRQAGSGFEVIPGQEGLTLQP